MVLHGTLADLAGASLASGHQHPDKKQPIFWSTLRKVQWMATNTAHYRA